MSTQSILVVDDSASIRALVQAVLQSCLENPVITAASLSEAKEKMAVQLFDLAVVDLNLPDAQDGQAVDEILSAGIPVVVLTGTTDTQVHELISKKPIVDYVIKQQPGAMETLANTVRRAIRNKSRKALVVDDCAFFRMYLRTILENQCFHVLEASNALEAMDLLKNDSSIVLATVDQTMPGMNGDEFVAEARATHPFNKLGIIGITGADDPFIGVRFFKSGANDIVHKPFIIEELVSRVNVCVDIIDNLQQLNDQANKDALTRLYNRRFLFDAGRKMHNSALRGKTKLDVCIIDIDHFKRINDRYGHDKGDIVLAHVAETLSNSVRESDLVARMGGEEFCILLTGADDPCFVIERLRQAVESSPIDCDGAQIDVTISAGISSTLCSNLSEMIKEADKALYKAKSLGRNRVVRANTEYSMPPNTQHQMTKGPEPLIRIQAPLSLN